MRYDVVVIGSGLGGLICARQLARSGRSVVLIERHRLAGGCLQSYRRDGMEWDTGLHYVGGLAPGEPLHQAFQELGLLRLPWQRLDADGFDRITIGSRTFCLAEGYDRFVDTLARQFPAARQRLTDFVQLLQRVAGSDDNAMQHLSASAYDTLLSVLADPLLLSVVSAAAMRLELRRESLPLFTFAHALNSYIQSAWRLRGSGSLMVRSLVRDIEDAGGQMCCGTEVRRLKTQGDRVVEAVCTGDRRFEGRLFVSDVHPQLTFSWLGDSPLLKPVFRHRMAALTNTCGMFTVSLLVKPERLLYFNHNKYVYRTPDVWDLDDHPDGVGGVMVSARVPEDGSRYVRQLDLLTPMPWTLCQRWTDTAVGHRGEDYEQTKQRLADECIALAERVVDGLRHSIDKCYTSTPLTWRDYTLTPSGSAFGVRKDYRQPLMTMLSPRTPVPNLLLTGQSLSLHGIEGVTRSALNTLEWIKKTL